MRSNNAATLLRWGIAFVLFYGAITALLSSDVSLAHAPEILSDLFPGGPLLVIASLYGLALSAMLFWGKKVKVSSILAAITFALIVIIDFHDMGTVFPFIGLALASLALFDMTKHNIKNHGTNE